MKKLFVLFLFFSLTLEAKINLKGNFLNSKGLVETIEFYIYQGSSEKNIGSTKPDKNGNFSFISDLEYTGLLIVKMDKGEVKLVTDNYLISFEYDLDTNNFISLDSEINRVYNIFTFYNSKENISSNLSNILSLYNSVENKSFSEKLKNEISRLKDLKSTNDYEKYPFLNYYFKLNERLDNFGKNENSLKTDAIFFESSLKNDNSYLESTGLIKKVLLAYFTSEVTEIKDRNKIEEKLDSITENLLNNVVCESSRGQNILEISLELFKNSKLDTLYNKYLQKAEKLTCNIQNDKLKNLINSSSIKVGGVAPNYKFKNGLNNKASLFDFKAKNKIIVFYASWCGHCVTEMPEVIELYKKYNSKGVEFILVSLDDKKAEYEKFIKDFPKWNNYSELAGWESNIAKSFSVEGTPTIFLLNETNTIQAISHKIEDIKKLLP